MTTRRERAEAILGRGPGGKLNYAYADGYAHNAFVRDFGMTPREALRLGGDVPSPPPPPRPAPAKVRDFGESLDAVMRTIVEDVRPAARAFRELPDELDPPRLSLWQHVRLAWLWLDPRGRLGSGLIRLGRWVSS